MWKEEWKMSENTMELKKKRIGMEAFFHDFKKYSILGILIPFLLTIPSLVLQINWFRYDSIIQSRGINTAFEGWSYTHYITFTDQEEPVIRFIEKYEAGDGVFYQVLETLFGALLLILVIYVAIDMFRHFFGKQASITMMIPCRRQTLFLAKLAAATLVFFVASFLYVMKQALFDGWLGWDNGIYRLKDREFVGINSGWSTNVVVYPQQIIYLVIVGLGIVLGVVLVSSLIGRFSQKYEGSQVAVRTCLVSAGVLGLIAIVFRGYHIVEYSPAVEVAGICISLLLLAIGIFVDCKLLNRHNVLIS